MRYTLCQIAIGPIVSIAAMAGMAADAAEIRLRTSWEAAGTFVTLGDVAEIRGSEDEIDQLGRLRLFPSPSPGRERLLRSTEVFELLRLNEIDVEKHRVTGAETARIQGIRKSSDQGKPSNPATNTASRPDAKTHANSRSRTSAANGGGPVAPAANERSRAPRVLLVRYGEPVTIYGRGEGVMVRTEVRALSEGGAGELVTVETIDKPNNRRRFQAVVTGLREAEVYASGSMVPRFATISRVPPTAENPAGTVVKRHDLDNASQLR